MADLPSTRQADLLAGVELFRHLQRVSLARLCASIEPIHVERGGVVVRQGDPGDALYVVGSGAFGAYVTGPDGTTETRLATFLPGEYFGEMALLSDEPRSATVRAEEGGEVLRLSREHFAELLDQDPSVARHLLATLSHRLRSSSGALQQSNQLVVQVVDQELGRLAADRRRQVLQASILEPPSAATLRVLFGPDAADVGAQLTSLGVSGDHASAPLLQLLRARLEAEVGADAAQTFAREAASRLASNGYWDDALAILGRHGSRPAFLDLLGRALRAMPSLPRDRALRWIARISDEEAARVPDLALARAGLYEDTGDAAGAAAVLRSALSIALVGRDPVGARRLQEAVARLSSASHAPAGPGASEQDRWSAVWRRPRRLSGPLALATAGALVISAAVGGRVPGAFVSLLAAAIVLWVSDVISPAVVGLGLVAAFVIFGVATPAQAAAGFGSMDWLFAVAIFGIGAAVARSGLLYRAGLLFIRRMPRGLVPQAGGLLATGVLLSPLLPMAMGRAALTGPLALVVADALRLRERSPASAVLGLAAWIGSGPMLFLFLNASPACLLAWGLLPAASRARFDWAGWLVAAAPLGLFSLAATLPMLFLVLRPGRAAAPSHERLAVQLAVLGPPSRREWAMVAVLVLTVAGWLVGSWWGIDPATVALAGLVVAAATRNLDRAAFQGLDWNYLAFYGVVLTVARLASTLGLDQVVGAIAAEQLPGLAGNPVLFVFAVAAVTLLARLLLIPDQVILLLSLALIPVAPVAGVDPWVVVITVLATFMLWYVPSQSPEYLVAQATGEGRLFTRGQAQRVAFGYTVVVLGGLAVSVPYWRALGLL